MLIGIFSDIHGDIAGLQRALSVLQPAEKLVFLGDVHEFVPDVKQCIDLLRIKNVLAVKGNGDRHAVIGDKDGLYRSWLATLPMEYQEDGLVFVHKPKDPEDAFNRETFNVCFCGHTHRSFIISQAGKVKLLPGQEITLQPDQQYIIGIGSISQPREGEKKVVALYDSLTRRLRLVDLEDVVI